jgi:hypothetical protein
VHGIVDVLFALPHRRLPRLQLLLPRGTTEKEDSSAENTIFLLNTLRWADGGRIRKSQKRGEKGKGTSALVSCPSLSKTMDLAVSIYIIIIVYIYRYR